MNILSFSGFIPEQICDTTRFVRWQGEQMLSHYCGYAADFISQVLKDPGVDGAVYPRSCDSSRAIASYLKDCGKFLHQLHIPTGTDSAATGYLSGNLRAYQRALEEHYGISIADIPERCERINARNRQIAHLYEHLPEFSYAAYLDMLHGLLCAPLREQVVPEELPAKPAEGKRVFLAGSLLSDPSVVTAVERAGLSIVGDRLTESKRLFSAPEISPRGDIYENIARSILGNPPSPSQNRFDAILREDLEEIRSKQVAGVLFVTQKFCEPYDYLFPAYKRMLDEQKIPVLRLVRSGSTDAHTFDASLEAFSEIL